MSDEATQTDTTEDGATQTGQSAGDRSHPQHPATSPPLTAHALAALRAALQAGGEILAVYHGEFAVQQKADHTPLTEADLRAQQRIHEILEQHDPEVPFLGEEAADIPYDRRELWDRYWLVDPLDGTKEFVKRNGEFTVNIAYVSAADGPGRPLVGVVYAPVLSRAYLGVVGEGAYRLDDLAPDSSAPADWSALLAVARPLRPAGASTRRDPEARTAPAAARAAQGASRHGAPAAQGAPGRPEPDGNQAAPGTPAAPGSAPPADRPFTVVASRSHMSPETEAFVEDLRAEHPDLELVSAGSALKMCLVAEGAADAYPRFAPTMEWDTGAGHAVCVAAGAEVLAWPAREPLVYNKPDLVNPWFLVRRA